MNNLFDKYHPQFAAYYNMARQNIYITLQYISNLMGYKEGEGKESRLFEMQSVMRIITERPSQQIYLLKQLGRFFPFLRIMCVCEKTKDQIDNNTPEAIHKVLNNIFKVLNYERDRASHHNFIDERTDSEEYLNCERKVAYYLDHCYTVALRTIKCRYKKEAKDMEIFTSGRYKSTFISVNGKKVKKNERNHNYPYSIINKDNRLTDIGRILLISLLIEKRYASIFFDALQTGNKSDFYKSLNIDQRIILRETFSAFRIRLPKERLGNERSDILLGLDILNELKKAPKELFEHLSPIDQNKFRVQSTRGEDVLLKRSIDKFPIFAMKYIDEKLLFQNIRFQVNVGKYRFLKTKDKCCIDNESYMRILQKDVNGFGRIQEMENLRRGITNSWKSRSMIKSNAEITRNNPDIYPYITDSHAQYVYNNDKIGLGWPKYDTNSNINSYSLKDGTYIPVITDNNDVVCAQPKCWLSVYELPAMMFHILLNGYSGMKTEKLIKEEVEKYKVFFQDIIDGNISKVKCRDTKNPQPMEYGFIEEKYGIKWTNIPDKLRDFLVGRTRSGFNKQAAKVISEMIASNRHSINRFNDKIQKISGKDNKMGKKSYVEIRPGQLASYLMKDIIALQPTALHGTLKGTDKLTGLNYSILQANLSTYNAIYNKNEFDKLKSMFTNAKLIGTSNNQHPFLDKIFKDRPENTIKFYQSYMKHRLVWLNQILEKKNFEDVNILKPDRMKWAKKNSEYYKNLAKRYLSQPIELPRCLFENSIIDIMIEICSKNDKLQEFKEQLIKYRNKEKGVRFNTTYLIMKYHELVMNDKCQKFYSWDKGYKLIDKLEGMNCYKQTDSIEHYKFQEKINKYINTLKVKEKGNNRRNATNDEKKNEYSKIIAYKKELNENEKTLRRLKVQDILLFYMAKHIIGAKVDNFKMKSISPHKEEGILELQIPFKIKITLTNGIEKTIYQEKIKIKNHGDFFYFLYDDRIKSLLPQIEKAEIDRQELERELLNYDLARPEIFKLVLNLEKSINTKYIEMQKEQHGFTDLLNRIEIISPEKKEKIRIIRNAFGHNKYPEAISAIYELPEIATNIRDEFKATIDKI